MDAVYLHNKYGAPDLLRPVVRLRRLVDWVCDNWQRDDEGIWEVRGGRQHFVYSKLMCWVALDRGLRLADKRSFPADRARWLTVRDQIYEEDHDPGLERERQAFVQSFGSRRARRRRPDDAAGVLHVAQRPAHAAAPSTPSIGRSPQGGLVSDGLVYRYDADEDARTACAARKARSTCARSGWSRR